MKILIMLFLAGKLLTVTPSASVPEVDGVLAQYSEIEDVMLLAHSNLAGTNFYRIKKGDQAVAIYLLEDGHTLVPELYQVVKADAYAAQKSSESVLPNFDFTLRTLGSDPLSHDDDGWITFTDLYPRYTSPGNITLMTCYGASFGFDVTTGRLILELAPSSQVETR